MRLTPIPGDFDHSRTADLNDIDRLVAEIVAGARDESFDLSNDGTVDVTDLTQWLEVAAEENGFASAYLLGDSNLDGMFSTDDLVVVFQASEFEDDLTGAESSDSEISPIAGIVVAVGADTSVYSNYARSFAPPWLGHWGHRRSISRDQALSPQWLSGVCNLATPGIAGGS